MAHASGFALKKTTKVGDVLIADDGHTCLKSGQHCVVMKEKGRGFDALYVECKEGQHFLSAQLNRKGEIVGFFCKEV